MGVESVTPPAAASPSAATRNGGTAAGAGPVRSRLDVLDGYRGLACLMVVFYHQAQNLGVWPVKLWGFNGVHVFFILSGYLLIGPFLRCLRDDRQFPSLREFYLRRWVRIYPPYFVALLAFLALRVIGKAKETGAVNDVTHFLLAFNYFGREKIFSINPVFWSLAIEAQFYLLLPLLAIAARKLRLRDAGFTGMLFALGIAARLIETILSRGTVIATPATDPDPIRFVTIFSFLDLFAFGALVTVVQDRLRRRREAAAVDSQSGGGRGTAAALVIVGIALVLGSDTWYSLAHAGDWMACRSDLLSVVYPVVLSAGYSSLLLATVLDNWGVKVLAYRPFVRLGAISYSIYLYHVGVQFVLNSKVLPRFTGHLGYNEAAAVSAWVSLPFILALSYGMFLLVENPCLKWMDRRRRPSPAISTATQNNVV